jgi:hypothetical protein
LVRREEYFFAEKRREDFFGENQVRRIWERWEELFKGEIARRRKNKKHLTIIYVRIRYWM